MSRSLASTFAKKGRLAVAFAAARRTQPAASIVGSVFHCDNAPPRALSYTTTAAAGTLAHCPLLLGSQYQVMYLSTSGGGSTSAKLKLRDILESYRKEHFGQTLFSRFVKELVSATDVNHDGMISLDELTRLLDNIGAGEKITSQELEQIFDEFGHLADDGEKVIYIDDVALLMA